MADESKIEMKSTAKAKMKIAATSKKFFIRINIILLRTLSLCQVT